MIISTEWLLDYLSPRVPLPDLLTVLPRVGLDVEATHVLARELASVQIGFVRSKKNLEGTDDKFVCGVEVGAGDVRQIVCASAHPIEVGWGVPVALAGAELPTGAAIHEEHFHGVLSQGMICLDGELGLIAKGSGLQIFRDEALAGKKLTDVNAIDGALIHLKVYPNRPDCLGLIGIAREIAALLDIQLVLPDAPTPAKTNSAAVPVEIADPALCSRYTCVTVQGVTVQKSPPWLASRLMATGSRPINNVVDITNFVLKEWGHPLHAFDLAKVREKVVVRRMQPGERLKILDGRTIECPETNAPLTIADAKTPMALAGIMGGADSGISDTTVNVLLEAAHFESTNIRLSSRNLSVSTDASYRFERGMDPNETLEAARSRALALLFSDAAAQSASEVTDTYPVKVTPAVFSLPAERVSGYLGIPVITEQVKSSLNRLGYKCSDDLSVIETPTRRVDATDAVVLIEDVARVIGYDAITGAPSSEMPTMGMTSPLDSLRRSLREFLTANGFLELRGVPLEPATESQNFSLDTNASVTLLNPLNADLAQMRQSLIPFLLNTAELNAKRRAESFRYFEIDKVFAAGPQERWALGVVLGGVVGDVDWSSRRAADYFDLKGIIESALESIHVTGISLAPTKAGGFADGTAAKILVGEKALGVAGQVAPDLLAPRKIQVALFAAELFLDPLLSLLGSLPRYQPLARFPGIFRDLSFIVAKSVPYSSIEHAIRQSAGVYLETVQCIDVFAGKGISDDRRSIAVAMTFRAADRTLSSEEVASSVDLVIARLAADFSAELRNA